MKKLSLALAATVILTSLGTLTAPSFAGGVISWNPDSPPTHERPPRRTRSTYQCGGDLGYLRRVYEEELDLVVAEENVFVLPTCEDDDYGLMRSDGNAGAIRQHIAANEAMTSALFDANYRAEDVIGVRMTGDDSVILYVHTFHR